MTSFRMMTVCGLFAATLVAVPATAQVAYVPTAPNQVVPIYVPGAPVAGYGAPSSYPAGVPMMMPYPGMAYPGMTYQYMPTQGYYPIAPGNVIPQGYTVQQHNVMPQGYVGVPQGTMMPQGYTVPAPPINAAVYANATPLRDGVVLMERMTGGIDRLLAAAETLDELRIVLSRSERLRQAKLDSLTRQFIRERVVTTEVAAASGLTIDYLNWVFETLIEYGDRLGPTLSLPNFRLFPAARTASWSSIWARSYAPYLAAYPGTAYSPTYAPAYAPTYTPAYAQTVQVVRTTRLRAASDIRSAALTRVTVGTTLTLLAQNGVWHQVRTASGVTGWALSSDLAIAAYAAPTTLPYAGAESMIYWQNMQRAPMGHDSPYGWIYPYSTQTPTAQAPAVVTSPSER